MKITLIFISLTTAFVGSSASTNIECNYNIGDGYSVLGNIYQCIVNNDPNIASEESAYISGIAGTHQSGYSNDNVLGIYAQSKTIQVFPKSLEKFFKYLKLIWIETCQLKEIHQSDLKVFPHLIYLYLITNEIEVIEEGLFDFNPHLEVVGFQESKIIHIDPNVFDHLNKLRYFWFSGVPCVNKIISGSKQQVQETIEIVKSNCTNQKYSQVSKNLKKSQISTYLEYLESNSELFTNLQNFPSLQSKFDDLRLSSACSNCAQLIKISAMDVKVDNLHNLVTDGLKNIASLIYDPNFTSCSMNSTFDELKSSQGEIKLALSSVKSSISTQESKISSIEATLSELKKSQAEMKNALDEINKTLKTILKVC